MLNPTATHNPLTHDDVRTIASEKMGKFGRALLGGLRLNGVKPSAQSCQLHLEPRDCHDEACRQVGIPLVRVSSTQRWRTGRLKKSLRDREVALLLDLQLDFVPTLNGHNSSPSVDGGSSPRVRDGQVAGVETAAPATDARITYVCYCGFGISGPRGEGISDDIWNHEQWHRGQEDGEQEARDLHPAGKGLDADEVPPSRRTLLERLEDAETDLASARVIQERARIAFEESNGNVGVATWERSAAANALVESVDGGAA